ncbi:MAG: hypothetical protein HYW78_01085, partial [Parcubacteria group bacterium]|nr:hypothetical protein [Parcubacteria group bacterium]
NYTRVILYAIVAYLLYFIIDYFFKKRESKRIDFLPILFLGVYVVNTGIFREWSMHAFSNFYLNPGAALIAALLVYQVITNRIVLAVFLILFIANARMNIKKTFEIEVFGRRDAALIKSLETVVPRGESLCLGGNLIGAMYDHLTRYYLRRLQKCDDQSKHFLIFNEAMGQWYTDEKKRLVGDLQPVGCGMLMCYYRK